MIPFACLAGMDWRECPFSENIVLPVLLKSFRQSILRTIANNSFRIVADGLVDIFIKVLENLDPCMRFTEAPYPPCGSRSKWRTLHYTSLAHWFLAWQETDEELLHHLHCQLSIGGGGLHDPETCCHWGYRFGDRSEASFIVKMREKHNWSIPHLKQLESVIHQSSRFKTYLQIQKCSQ